MRVRVATLNVWALPEPLSRKPSQRIQALAEQLDSLSVHVAAFQEVWTPNARRALVRAGRAVGLEHEWHKQASIGGSGLLVLSRAPIATARFERYSLRGLPQQLAHGEYYGGKGFVSLRIDSHEGPIHLINTHLHARYPGDVPHEYVAHRTGQVVQLALRLREIRTPLIVIGDFNFSEEHPEHTILTGLTGLRDTAAELNRRQPTVSRTNPYRSETQRRDRRVDYVFARDGGGRRMLARSMTRVLDETFLLDGARSSYSNHAGLLGEFEVIPGGSSRASPMQARAVHLAQRLLFQGQADAWKRRRDQRVYAGAGLGCAAMTALGERNLPRLTRRRMLRTSLHGAALLALTPTVGFSILAEVFGPGEIEAFQDLSDRLASSQHL